ncbi:AAA family ATPase [Actinomadura welshii]
MNPDPFAPAAELRQSELHDRIFAADPSLIDRWRQLSGEDGWREGSGLQFRFATVKLQRAGWLHKRGKKWRATGLGRAALEEHPDAVAFYRDARHAYNHWKRHKDAFEAAADYAEALPEGRWAAAADVAAETGVDAAALVRLFRGVRPDGWHRLLADDGTLPRAARLTEPERDEWLRLLEDDSVSMVGGRADPQLRLPAADVRMMIVPADEEELRSRRAWLVRAPNAAGGDLIESVWLTEQVCSLRASRLRDLPPGVPAEQVGQAVREDYTGIGSQERDRLAAEFHMFLSRMNEGDIVVTNEGTDVYLGEIAGGPSFVSSVGERANLQRAVRWHNGAEPPDYDDLPDDFSALVSNPDAEIIELTSLLPELEKLLGGQDALVEQAMVLNPVGESFAKKLHIDQGRLQECVELLRERPQLIFYGPPGTGKTYLARHLAKHLTAGRPECVQLVQFHPAYSYEDFFEGYRPAKSADGTISFDLVRGPFRRLVSAARAHPGRPTC